MESHFGLPSADPPKREMVFFPQLTTTPPSKSDAFRRVLWTGLYSQLAIHTIPAEGQLGDEALTVDQIITVTAGQGIARTTERSQDLHPGDILIVPAGTQHQIVNSSEGSGAGDSLVLTITYSPAAHGATTVHYTKKQAEEDGLGGDTPPVWSQHSQEQNARSGYVG